MSYLKGLIAQANAPKPHEEYQRQLEATNKFIEYWKQADETDRKQIIDLFNSVDQKIDLAIEMVGEA